MKSTYLIFAPIWVFILLSSNVGFGQESTKSAPAQSKFSDLDAAVIQSFAETHDGWSSDEVLLNDELNQAFLKACHEKFDATDLEFNWRLLNLRKAGKLKIKATKRSRHDGSKVRHIAEIAARSTLDRFSVSIDNIMSDPEKRLAFDQTVKSIAPKADLYSVRKTAFQLRKARRLRPELITRIATWGRKIESFKATELSKDNSKIPPRPGIYIFRDQSGYLYIGQTDDLRKRLTTHLDSSHNESLAKYLGNNLDQISIEIHSFDPESRAKEVMIRRAYESEMIASRKPRFNILP